MVEKENKSTLAKLYNQACFIDSFHKIWLFVHCWNKTDRDKLQAAVTNPHLKYYRYFQVSVLARFRVTFTLNDKRQIQIDKF